MGICFALPMMIYAQVSWTKNPDLWVYPDGEHQGKGAGDEEKGVTAQSAFFYNIVKAIEKNPDSRCGKKETEG